MLLFGHVEFVERVDKVPEKEHKELMAARYSARATA